MSTQLLTKLHEGCDAHSVTINQQILNERIKLGKIAFWKEAK